MTLRKLFLCMLLILSCSIIHINASHADASPEKSPYELSVWFDKETVTQGSPLLLEVELKNISSQTCSFMPVIPEQLFDIQVFNDEGTAELTRYGEKQKNFNRDLGGVPTYLKSGASLRYSLPLHLLFDLSMTGTYFVKASPSARLLSRPVVGPKYSIAAIRVTLFEIPPSKTAPPKTESLGNRPKFTLVVPDFKGVSDLKACEIRDRVIEQRTWVQDALVGQLKHESISPNARVEALSLLEFSRPDREIIDALIENSNVFASRRPDMDVWHPGPYTIGFLARKKLVSYGHVAELRILEHIGTPWLSPKLNPKFVSTVVLSYIPTRADALADILTQINGKATALKKLRQAQAGVTNMKVRTQFEQVIASVQLGKRTGLKY